MAEERISPAYQQSVVLLLVALSAGFAAVILVSLAPQPLNRIRQHNVPNSGCFIMPRQYTLIRNRGQAPLEQFEIGARVA